MNHPTFLLDLLDGENWPLGEILHLVFFNLNLIMANLGSSIRLRGAKVDITIFRAPIKNIGGSRCRGRTPGILDTNGIPFHFTGGTLTKLVDSFNSKSEKLIN